MLDEQPRQVRRKYTPEFKKQIVELCKIGNRTKRDIMDEYGLPESLVYEWIKIYSKYGTFDRPTIRESKKTDTEKLEERIKYLEMENDILKHVALMLGAKTPQDLEN